MVVAYDTHSPATQYMMVHSRSIMDPTSVSTEQLSHATREYFKQLGAKTDDKGNMTITPEQFINAKQGILHARPETDPRILTQDAARMRATDEAFAKQHTAPDGLIHENEVRLGSKTELLARQEKAGIVKHEAVEAARKEWRDEREKLGFKDAKHQQNHSHNVASMDEVHSQPGAKPQGQPGAAHGPTRTA